MKKHHETPKYCPRNWLCQYKLKHVGPKLWLPRYVGSPYLGIVIAWCSRLLLPTKYRCSNTYKLCQLPETTGFYLFLCIHNLMQCCCPSFDVPVCMYSHHQLSYSVLNVNTFLDVQDMLNPSSRKSSPDVITPFSHSHCSLYSILSPH